MSSQPSLEASIRDLQESGFSYLESMVIVNHVRNHKELSKDLMRNLYSELGWEESRVESLFRVLESWFTT